MTVFDLVQAIQEYDFALQKLLESINLPTSKAQKSVKVNSAQVLAVLIARDRIHSLLPSAYTPNAAGDLLHLSQLDAVLKDQAAVIAPFTDAVRDSFQPDSKAWWWFLEVPKNGWSDRFDWLWSALSVTCLTISVALISDIAPRFWVGGPDSLGAFTVSVQSVLTLLTAGSTLTTAGQESLKRFLKTVKIPEKYWHELGCLTAVLLASSFYTLRQSLPQIATKFYTNPGIENLRQGDWGSAEEQFKRAIQLNADDAEAYFYLGILYEDLQRPDEAIPNYKLAIQGGILSAINNLARLNIFKKNYGASVALLLKALDTDRKESLDPKIRRVILKNLGWARLLQKNYPDAEARLLEAINLESTLQLENYEKADTHCLLAQVMDAQGEQKAALSEWKLCNQYANITIPEHDQWVTIAQQRLLPSP